MEWICPSCTHFGLWEENYNLKKDGWLNNLIEEKNQTIKMTCCHEFFPPLSPPSQTKTTLSWIGIVAVVCFSFFLNFSVLLFLILIAFFIDFNGFTSLHFEILGRSFMAGCFIQYHNVALKLDIDIFKAFLLPMWDSMPKPTS